MQSKGRETRAMLSGVLASCVLVASQEFPQTKYWNTWSMLSSFFCPFTVSSDEGAGSDTGLWEGKGV